MSKKKTLANDFFYYLEIKNLLLLIFLFCSVLSHSQPTLPARTVVPAKTTNNIQPFGASGFIEVNDSSSPESSFSISQLIKEVLISGGNNCLTSNVSNVVVSPNLLATDSNRSWGYFNKATSNFPFNSGIVLSTGYAHNAGNDYINGVLIDNLSSLGDVDLANVLNIPPNFLTNASYIEFDFVPITSEITFNYLLASEEYGDGYECSYSDAFALLLRKSGTTTYTNLAVLPNNGGIVSTLNIHPDISGANGSCAAVNEQYFGGYNTTNTDTNFQGRTIPLTATATVTPGDTYHFKMVIADYSDHQFDTAVFLEAGSFDIGVKITDAANNILPAVIPICETPQVLKANIQVPNATYTWLFNNVVISGANTNTYTALQPGIYTVEVMLPLSTCLSTSSITIDSGTKAPVEITDINGLVLPSTITVCDVVNKTLKVQTTATTATYQWYFNNGIIAGATTDTYTATQVGSYSVKVADPAFDCVVTETISIDLDTLSVVSPITKTLCSPTAATTFDLVALQSQMTTALGATFYYYTSLVDAQVENTNYIINPSAYNTAATSLFALVKKGSCAKIVTINLDVTLTPSIINQPVNKVVCKGENTSFTVDNINAIGYQWQVNTGTGFIDLVNNATYSGVTTNTLSITNAQSSLNGSSYKLIVKSNCLPDVNSNTVVLTVSEILNTVSTINVSCFEQADGTISVIPSGGTPPYTYLWSNNATTSAISGLAPATYTVQVTDAIGCTKNESIVITQPSVLATTLKVKNVSCNGVADASIEVIPSGGTAPFTYQWAHTNATSSTLSSLAVGTYSVTVKDAKNCTKTEQIIITEPQILSAIITSKNVSCIGTYTGEAAVQVSGGTPPYSYNWNNGATMAVNSSLRPGTFSVTVVDANGCIVSDSVTITEPTLLTVSSLQTKAGCNGATISSVISTVTGGTPPYTYLWSNGLTTPTADNLLPGTYNLRVTDANGCIVNHSVSVIATTNLSLTFNKINISCNGLTNGSASAVVSGGKAPYFYNWSTGATTSTVNNLAVGTYTLTVTDDYGCTVTDTVIISQPNALTAAHSQTNVSCHGLSDGGVTLMVTGGTAPYTYQWSNAAKTSSLNQIPAGVYNVIIKDANNCTISNTITISQPADVAVPISSNQTFCTNSNAKISDLMVIGSNVKWYQYAVGGNPLNAADLLVNGNYFASQTINGCESFARTGINVVINNTAIPSGMAIQEFCEPFVPKISDLQVSGTNIKWYNTAVGGNLLTNSTTLVDGVTYYASQTLNGCESSLRFAVKVNIYPSNPLVTNFLAICDTATVQDISIDGYISTQLKWYSSLTATVPLSQSHILTTGTYYVSTVNHNLCESARTAVNIVISINAPLPTTNTLQVFCNSAIVGDLVATGTPGGIINWYTSAQATVPLSPTASLFSGTYYVDQELSPCKSARIAVAVRVYPTTAPTMTNFALCEGATVADLYLKGSTNTKYVWFIDNTTTTPLPDTYILTTGYYYVAIDYTGCISSRKSVYVDVNARPSSPTGNLVQNFNYQAKVSNLIMNQPNVVWYLSYNDAINKMNALDSTHSLVNGATYYGVLVDANGCNSYPTAVKVDVTLSLNNLEVESLKYYPNPVDNELVISYIDTIETVEVYNMLGQRVLKNNYKKEMVSVDLSSVSSGAYMVNIITAKGSQFIKIIKK